MFVNILQPNAPVDQEVDEDWIFKAAAMCPGELLLAAEYVKVKAAPAISDDRYAALCTPRRAKKRKRRGATKQASVPRRASVPAPPVSPPPRAASRRRATTACTRVAPAAEGALESEIAVLVADRAAARERDRLARRDREIAAGGPAIAFILGRGREARRRPEAEEDRRWLADRRRRAREARARNPFANESLWLW